MIIGDLLLEVKASANATIKREDFYQIIGYVLLDCHDAYQIERVGLYLARFGHLVTWTIPQVPGTTGRATRAGGTPQGIRRHRCAQRPTVVSGVPEASHPGC